MPLPLPLPLPLGCAATRQDGHLPISVWGASTRACLSPVSLTAGLAGLLGLAAPLAAACRCCCAPSPADSPVLDWTGLYCRHCALPSLMQISPSSLLERPAMKSPCLASPRCSERSARCGQATQARPLFMFVPEHVHLRHSPCSQPVERKRGPGGERGHRLNPLQDR